ncbi:unnamed protein product, partial [Symbiodinium sp. KB8]
CMARMDGTTNMMRISGPTEELKASAYVLQSRARTVKSSLEEMLQKARAAKATAAQRVEREVRKAEALKEAARQVVAQPAEPSQLCEEEDELDGLLGMRAPEQ